MQIDQQYRSPTSPESQQDHPSTIFEATTDPLCILKGLPFSHTSVTVIKDPKVLTRSNNCRRELSENGGEY